MHRKIVCVLIAIKRFVRCWARLRFRDSFTRLSLADANLDHELACSPAVLWQP